MTKGELVVLSREQDLGSEYLGIVLRANRTHAWVAWTEGTATVSCTIHPLRDLTIVTDENQDEIEMRSQSLQIRP